MIAHMEVKVSRQGLYPITDQVQALIPSGGEGLCSLFIQHTSASLLIQENYDNSARLDLENWLNRLVPENDPLYTHTLEGADDMPAHIKAALTATQISIPYQDGRLLLGTWQGVFLWEHRHQVSTRRVVVHI
jgi:secondary thiamine-phosphate synthase enzyme